MRQEGVYVDPLQSLPKLLLAQQQSRRSDRDRRAQQGQIHTGTAGALGALSPAGAEAGASPCDCACSVAEGSCGMAAAGAVTWDVAAKAGACAIVVVGLAAKAGACAIVVVGLAAKAGACAIATVGATAGACTTDIVW